MADPRSFLARPAWTVLLACTLAMPAGCVAERDCMPQVRGGWVRLSPVGMPMLAGFGRIDNACAAPVTIVAAGSPAFGSVELHESRIAGGVSRMRAVPELKIDARGKAEMQPGGLHLMLMQPVRPLEAGDAVELEFTLSDGRKLRGEFEVRAADAR